MPRAGPTSAPAGVAAGPDGTVTGVPRRGLRLEGAVMLAGSLTAYSATGQLWLAAGIRGRPLTAATGPGLTKGWLT